MKKSLRKDIDDQTSHYQSIITEYKRLADIVCKHYPYAEIPFLNDFLDPRYCKNLKNNFHFYDESLLYDNFDLKFDPGREDKPGNTLFLGAEISLDNQLFGMTAHILGHRTSMDDEPENQEFELNPKRIPTIILDRQMEIFQNFLAKILKKFKFKYILIDSQRFTIAKGIKHIPTWYHSQVFK